VGTVVALLVEEEADVAALKDFTPGGESVEQVHLVDLVTQDHCSCSPT
jgi:hypothetical protein